jgi:hypothetical protein
MDGGSVWFLRQERIYHPTVGKVRKVKEKKHACGSRASRVHSTWNSCPTCSWTWSGCHCQLINCVGSGAVAVVLVNCKPVWLNSPCCEGRSPPGLKHTVTWLRVLFSTIAHNGSEFSHIVWISIFLFYYALSLRNFTGTHCIVLMYVYIILLRNTKSRSN